MAAVTISHPALENPIYLNWSTVEKLTPMKLLEEIKKRQQSKRDLQFDQQMRIRMQHVKMPKGGRPGAQ